MERREIEQVIREKQSAYHKNVQSRRNEELDIYAVKYINREARDKSWGKFFSNMEGDTHGRKIVAYNLMKHINQEEKETVHLNVITKDKWIEHYREL